MKPFTNIEAFRNVIRNVSRYCGEHGKPLPTIDYVGTEKLHGTNFGIRITDNKIQPQGRNRILDIQSDNYGVAAFCHNKDELFRNIIKNLNSSDFTLFGEWCGKGIQKGVALSEIDKHLVIFCGWDAITEKYVSVFDIFEHLTSEQIIELNAHRIYFINQVDTYKISIDFSVPGAYLEALETMTLAVEKESPWGKFHGVSGTGEGIVFVPADPKLAQYSDLWFKVKGLEHKNAGKTGNNLPKGNLSTDPVKVASIKEFIEVALPDWRLEQGISQLEQDGKELTPVSTGAYIKWICNDIIKENSDVLAANNLCWKDVQGLVATTARQYFLTEIDKLALKV